ncbi:MAG: energy transducer TonB [Rickettsiales bacterium]|nr:energy transducer TonB [Pseudomonadota bacterium]MDA0966240.1 energy transducer TonB [Pseudomonadota bacterium]MDG4543095.1 energy transducer TonB [Rickettsiales bacterium]MDG4545293.1 energy transducer TonB [Rickettsiales bacterium]MDG4547742.1 energy transducer TonB [Rickettsiales bacterium]
MSVLLNNSGKFCRIGTATGASLTLHVVVLAAFLYFVKQTEFYDNGISAIERSSVVLNFTKPKPAFEKTPLKKIVKSEKQVAVLKEAEIAKPLPNASLFEEPIAREEVKDKYIEESVEEKTDYPIKDVANNSFIKDASFKGVRVSPKYPKRALMLGLEGKVVIKALIDIDGVIKDVELFESSGYRILDEAVMQVAWKWKFEPSYVNNVPTRQWVKAPYEFVLK